jgi:hypothetical protein
MSAMPTEIVRQQTVEESELLRKREELATVRATLAERELELADVRAQLRSFEGRYLREVGGFYSELDEWTARIARLEASINKSPDSVRKAEEARERAERTREAASGEASRSTDFKPSTDLKNLFRDVAKRIHPDFAKDDDDRQRRTRLMAEANEAYRNDDAEGLQRILDGYNESDEFVKGEGIHGELHRIIRQIQAGRRDITAIEQQIASLYDSEIAKLKQRVEVAERENRDLLMELAISLKVQIADLRKTHRTLEERLYSDGE